MAVYINGIGIISPQHSFGTVEFLQSPKSYSGNRLTCIEPEYTGWIDARAIRRMSRIIRMGVASAGLALKEASLTKPDAIITGTGFGCLDDTGIFLNKIVELNEEALNPTPFIQSTHNTIGSQVALLLQCYGYNQTYSHRAFSFEHALEDAGMMLLEKNGNILVGGVDETTNLSFDIIRRFGAYKENNASSLEIFRSKTNGYLQGEGAGYFLLSGEKGLSAYACIRDVKTIYKTESIGDDVRSFLEKNSVKPSDVQLVLTGKNGDYEHDIPYDELTQRLFPHATVGAYKHLCGEYQTSNAFAVWIAARVLKEERIPAAVLQKESSQRAVRHVLIYNKYLGKHHSLILLESC